MKYIGRFVEFILSEILKKFDQIRFLMKIRKEKEDKK